MLERYIAVGVYLIVLALITWVASRRKVVSDFLFASHDIGWKMLAISIFASIISSYNVVLTLTFTYLFGPYFFIIFLGALLAFLGIYFIAKKYEGVIKAIGFNNIIDLFRKIFDDRVASILNLSFIFVLFLFIVLQFFINTTIFSEFMGWDKYTSSIIVGGIVLAYTMLGGLKVEIYTDVFQGLLMFLIIGLAFMVDASNITSETMNLFISDTSLLFGALALAAGQFLTLLVQPEMWQRVAAAKSLLDVKKGFIFSWVLISAFIIPEIIIGISVRASGTIADSNNIFYDILKQSSPDWYVPVVIVGLFGAFMSTLDSSLFAIGSQLGRYGFIVRRSESTPGDEVERDRLRVKQTRLSILIVTLAALASSLFLADFLTTAFGLISLLSVISVAVIAALLLKFSPNMVSLSILVGIAVFVFIFFGGYITSEPHTSLYPSLGLVSFIVIQYFCVRTADIVFKGKPKEPSQ